MSIPAATAKKSRQSNLDLDRVIQAIPTELIYNDPVHGWHKAGDKWRGSCPWHDSKSGTSFVVTVSNNLWYCAGCGKGGGPISYIAAQKGLSTKGCDFLTVARILYGMANEPWPELHSTVDPEEYAAELSMRVKLERLYSDCEAALLKHQPSIDFIAKRGLSLEEAKRLRLGYLPRGADLHGLPCGSLYGYIVFPWLDSHGQPLTLYGHRGEDMSLTKTMAMAGKDTKSSPLYFDRVLAAGEDEAVLVEGVFDSAVAQSKGDARVCGYIGSTIPYSQVVTIFAARGIRRVYVAGDPDNAGANGQARALAKLDAAGIVAFSVPKLPSDPDEFILSDGIEQWKAHVATSQSYPMVLAQSILDKHQVTGPSCPEPARRAAADEATEKFQDIRDRSALATAVQLVKRATHLPIKLKARAAGDGLIYGDNGKPVGLVHNAIQILMKEWPGVLKFNEFSKQIMVTASTDGVLPDAVAPREWTTDDGTRATAWLQSKHGMSINTSIVVEGAVSVANRASYHPVRDYLDGLRWDGTPRLRTFITKHMGASEDDAAERGYVERVGEAWMVSGVARIYRPGVKADHVLILEGEQGVGKSSAFKVIGGEWFTDELGILGSKDADQQLHGVWIIEIAELDGFSRAEVSRIKAFFSRSVDRFRPPYARAPISFERQCIFGGTVNQSQYFRDETGNRRFWPVKCGRIDIDWLAGNRDQLWAEARTRFEDGVKWWLEGEVLKAAVEQQEGRMHGDPWEEDFADWLKAPSERLLSDGSIVQREISVRAFLNHMGIAMAAKTQIEQTRVARLFARAGYERRKSRVGEKFVWGYKPKQVSS